MALQIAPLVAALVLLVPPFVGSGPAQGTPGVEPTVIKMTAKKYTFDPSTITVERGHPVRLEVTALDHTHGIEIEEFGVKSRLEKGKPTAVEFTPDRTGTFTFKCSVFCGLGHGKMKGTLTVVEPKS
jgi:cytochrome c oxidase subunit 2